MAHTAQAAPFVLHCTRIGKGGMEKFGINCQRQSELFIVTFNITNRKSTMNAPCAFGNCAESILLALASAQQCLAALQWERGHLVQPLRKPPTGLVPPLTKAQLIFISDFPIGFQIGN